MTNWQKAQQYPVFAEEDGQETAVSRYRAFPTIEDLRAVALFGFSVYANPAVLEQITDDFLYNAITSAMNEIEMKEGITITPTEYTEPYDLSEGSADYFNPFNGYKLTKWPATQLLSLQYVYPHATSTDPTLSYEVPPQWISLRRNRISVIPGKGSPAITQGGSGSLAAGVMGRSFSASIYRPSALRIRYIAGFDPCKVPALLVDMILTLATIRLLTDITPVLFPYSGVSNSIDGVSQSAQTPIFQFLQTRITMLEKKYVQQAAALKGAFGRLMKMSILTSGG